MKVLLLLNGSRERYEGGAGEARLEIWSAYCGPDTQLEIGYLPSLEESGGVSKNFAFGSGEAVRKNPQLYPDRIEQAEQDGYDAVIIHCCSDPGLEESRRRVRIPVIGPGEATLRAGQSMSSRIGMTVPSPKAVDHHWEQVSRLGLESVVVGVEPIQSPIGEFKSQDPAAMTDAFVAAAQRLIERGAEVICPSGLAFVPVRVSAREATERLGIPVLDPALIAVTNVETAGKHLAWLPARDPAEIRP